MHFDISIFEQFHHFLCLHFLYQAQQLNLILLIFYIIHHLSIFLIFLLAAIILVGGTWEKRITGFENPGVYAWWGTIYPEFCFEKVEDNGENKPVKISFWLAKALDW